MEKVIFNVTFKEQSHLKDMFDKLRDIKALVQFLFHSRGRSITIELTETSSLTEKQRMYKYLNGVLLNALMEAKHDAGEIMDKAECMMQMKYLFAKDVITDNEGNSLLVLMHQSDMTKNRLNQFITDIIFHLESEYGVEAPDAEAYKLALLNNLKNRNFKKV